MFPPRLVRRLLLTPLLWVAMLALVVVLPLPLVVTAAVARLRRSRGRVPRLLTFALVYAVLEAAALLACLGLWLASGFGLRLRTAGFQDAHYDLLGWLLAVLVRVAERVFGLRLLVHGPAPAPPGPDPAGPEDPQEEDPLAEDREGWEDAGGEGPLADPEDGAHPGGDDPLAEDADAATPDLRDLTPGLEEGADRRPVLVLSRHAGPGDSFLLVHQLLNVYRQRPRIIMKDTLQLDPAVDVICNRLPNAFISPRPGVDTEILEQISRLGGSLDPDGALVLFPEGGNFTRRRRLRAIRKLEELGLVREAYRARDLEHLLPPRPRGVIAAVGAAPVADVVFVAHTGLDQLASVKEVWDGIPLRETVQARWWHVPAPTIPEGDAELTEWLYDWWDRIDEWVDNQQARSLPPPV